jgi:hypothetical protein
MERKSVMPMRNNLHGCGGYILKYGTIRSLMYINSNPFRFPISFLGLPIFLLRIAEREW